MPEDNSSGSPDPSSMPSAPPPIPPTSPGPMPTSGTPMMSEREIADGKVFAILSYVLNLVGIPFWLVPLIMRNNDFSLYHAKQCLGLWLFALLAGTVCGLLSLICIGFVMAIVVVIFMLVVNIMGLIVAINGQAKPIPLMGKYFETWFEGIRRVPA